MVRAITLVFVVALSGCAGFSWEQTDDATCRSYGLSPGSDSYSACRMQLTQQRAVDRAALLNYSAVMMQSAGPSPLPAGAYRMPGQATFTSCTQQGVFLNCFSQ